MTALDRQSSQAASGEVVYDDAGRVAAAENAADKAKAEASAPAAGAGTGCHAGTAEMKKAAAAAGKSETLEQYAKDYPQGPHDQPQSMCPAFGSLRVGLRMRRTATVLSGSACCVYGLTFTSHFYGAKRTVGYVPFSSETLVTGKLFEDIRRKSANYEIVGKPGGQWASMFETLAVNVAEAPPMRPTPLSQDGLLGLFKGDAVGRGVVLEPASQADMRGHEVVEKPTLEIVYDAA